jgi:hypothetical protein|tara:strand:- start:1369 stop:1533 length:165 start_codon:yes stop_codon:yes gene_type:complete
MNVKLAIDKLDDCYSTILDMVEDKNNTELINSLLPILNHIDEAQNELENINLTT